MTLAVLEIVLGIDNIVFISLLVNKLPTVRMLALSFLVLIGAALIADGLNFHIPKGYIYFAMAFSVSVEVLNIKIRGRAEKPLTPYKPMTE